MFNFLSNIFNDMHALIVHFPIGLLVVSFGLSVAARFKPGWLMASWVTFVIGALATLPATVSGLAAHAPYEGTELAGVIETHQLLGFATTLIFVGLLVWRGWQMRRGSDIGSTWSFIAVMAVGIVFLTLAGGNGGELVYTHAVNVRGINPLLP